MGRYLVTGALKLFGSRADIARSKPGRINYATAGPGTGRHLVVELIKYSAGIDMQHLAVQDGEPLGSTPQEARRFTQAEIDRWTNLIRKANISAQ